MTDDILNPNPDQDKAKELTLEESIATQLASIKRDDGSQKYDSVEKALEALAHAQKYIPELEKKVVDQESNLNVLETKLEKAATVEDVITRINDSKPEDTNNTKGVETVSEDKIGELVKKELERVNAMNQVENNRKQVNEALVSKFGSAEAARLALSEKTKELGVGPDFLTGLAEKSPTAFLAIFNGGQSPATPPTTSSVNLRLNDGPKEEKLEEFSLTDTSSSDQLEMMRKIKANVYSKHDVVA